MAQHKRSAEVKNNDNGYTLLYLRHDFSYFRSGSGGDDLFGQGQIRDGK